MASADIENLIKSQVIEVARNVEQHLDAELEKLENMDVDDMERLRGDRMKQLKEKSRKRQEWLAMVKHHQIILLIASIERSSFLLFVFLVCCRAMENIQRFMRKKNSLKYRRNLKILCAIFIKRAPLVVELLITI